jgi:hypothetical protein
MSSTAAQVRARLPRIAEVAVNRARLTVVPRPRTRPRAPRVPFVTLVSVIMLGGVIGLLMFNTSMQQASFRAAALEQQAADLTAQQEALRMELQALRDPQRISIKAQQMDMVMPAGGPLVLPLGGGEVLGDEQTVAPGFTLPESFPGAQRPAALDLDPVTVRERSGNDRQGRADNRADSRNGARNGARNGDRDGAPNGERRR